MLYQPTAGTLWDPSILWHDGTYYAFYMLQRHGSPHWGDCVGLATSSDGVHWREEAPVFDLAFRAHRQVYKPFVTRCGERFILNHGAFSGRPGTGNDTLCFWESRDLRRWTYLGETHPDTRWYRDTDERWDHMYMRPKDERRPRAGYWGYPVAVPRPELVAAGHACGLMDSPDGVTWTPREPPSFTWGDTPPLPYLEIGGCERLGSRYYLIGGTVPYLGNRLYAMYTFVADAPTGPFRPDREAYRLCGAEAPPAGQPDAATGVQWLAAFARGNGEVLVSNYLSDDPDHVTAPWLLPLRAPVVTDGHLRLAYWRGNEAAKGAPLPLPPRQDVRDGTAWLPAFDPQAGGIVEGVLTVHPRRDGCRAGLALEGADGDRAVLLDTGVPYTEIVARSGRQETVLDIICPGSACVAGLTPGPHAVRLWARRRIFELYLDDRLVQAYRTPHFTGRVGLTVDGGAATLHAIRGWAMR
jgi:hypothetical protein